MSETEKIANRTHPGLHRWCARWSTDLARLAEKESRISYMESELPGLLAETGLFKEILTTCLDEKHHPFIQTPTMFDSEIVLYRDSKGGFSLRMYLWGPGCYDPIHDHNSWGVIGSVSGGLTVTTYERIDEDHSDTQARLAEKRSEIVSPGCTYSVLPLDEGIHRTGNPGLYTIMQVGIYGENLTGRNYINLFNESNGRIVKLYTPQVKKRILAREALLILGGNARRE